MAKTLGGSLERQSMHRDRKVFNLEMLMIFNITVFLSEKSNCWSFIGYMLMLSWLLVIHHTTLYYFELVFVLETSLPSCFYISLSYKHIRCHSACDS